LAPFNPSINYQISLSSEGLKLKDSVYRVFKVGVCVCARWVFGTKAKAKKKFL